MNDFTVKFGFSKHAQQCALLYAESIEHVCLQRVRDDHALLYYLVKASIEASEHEANEHDASEHLASEHEVHATQLRGWLHSESFGRCVVQCAAQLCRTLGDADASDSARADVMNVISLALTGKGGGSHIHTLSLQAFVRCVGISISVTNGIVTGF